MTDGRGSGRGRVLAQLGSCLLILSVLATGVSRSTSPRDIAFRAGEFAEAVSVAESFISGRDSKLFQCICPNLPGHLWGQLACVRLRALQWSQRFCSMEHAIRVTRKDTLLSGAIACKLGLCANEGPGMPCVGTVESALVSRFLLLAPVFCALVANRRCFLRV